MRIESSDYSTCTACVVLSRGDRKHAINVHLPSTPGRRCNQILEPTVTLMTTDSARRTCGGSGCFRETAPRHHRVQSQRHMAATYGVVGPSPEATASFFESLNKLHLENIICLLAVPVNAPRVPAIDTAETALCLAIYCSHDNYYLSTLQMTHFAALLVYTCVAVA